MVALEELQGQVAMENNKCGSYRSRKGNLEGGYMATYYYAFYTHLHPL